MPHRHRSNTRYDVGGSPRVVDYALGRFAPFGQIGLARCPPQAASQATPERLRVYVGVTRERSPNLARVARTEQLDRAFIDFFDLHRIHELLQKMRMLIEIRAQLGHAFRAQAL